MPPPPWGKKSYESTEYEYTEYINYKLLHEKLQLKTLSCFQCCKVCDNILKSQFGSCFSFYWDKWTSLSTATDSWAVGTFYWSAFPCSPILLPTPEAGRQHSFMSQPFPFQLRLDNFSHAVSVALPPSSVLQNSVHHISCTDNQCHVQYRDSGSLLSSKNARWFVNKLIGWTKIKLLTNSLEYNL